MKFLLLIGLSMVLNLSAQNTELINNRIINPSFTSLIDSTILYSKLTILNSEIGLFESEIGAFYKIQNKFFHSSIAQYGYKNFKETKLKFSTSHQLSGELYLGVNINFHHLYIAETENYKAISFDVGTGMMLNKFALYLLIENPLNAAYLNNDIVSRLLISPYYSWNSNLTSKLNFEVSLQTGFKVDHKLSYNYQNKISISILQCLKPFRYGFNVGYTVNKFQFYSQYEQLNNSQHTGFIIIYTPGDD